MTKSVTIAMTTDGTESGRSRSFRRLCVIGVLSDLLLTVATPDGPSPSVSGHVIPQV